MSGTQFGFEQPDWKADPTQRPPDVPNMEQPYGSRTEVEQKIFLDRGLIVTLEGSWKGRREIFVPRWSMYAFIQSGKAISEMVYILFPNDLFFLYNINSDEMATAAARIYDILIGKVYPQMAEIVMSTCGILPDERGAFERSITPRDFMEIFTVIFEQNLGSEELRAITKKLQRLLGEKFRLENAFPTISDIMGEDLYNALTISPTNSSPFSGSTVT